MNPNPPSIRILIVEDEVLFAADLRARVERLGHEVIGIVSRGDEAIEVALRQHPDLMLMDIVLPGELDGIEANRRIHEQRPTAAIVMSGYSTPELIARARDAGFGAYLCKPIDTGELERAIVLALARHQDLADLIHEMKRRAAAEESLARREAMYRSFVESFDGIAFRMDPTGRPGLVHGSALLSLTGYTADELKSGGGSWRQLTHPDDVELLEEAAKRLTATIADHATVEHRIICRDGSVRWVRAHLHRSADSGGPKPCLEGALYDITENRQAVDRIRTALAAAERARLEVGVLYSVGKDILDRRQVDETLRRLVEACRDLAGADGASLELRIPETGRLQPAAQVDFDGLHSADELLSRIDDCLHGDESQEEHDHFWCELDAGPEPPCEIAGRRIRNLFVTPFHHGETSGMLTLANLAAHPDEDDAHFVRAVAELAAIALHNHRLSRQLESSEALTRALFEHGADAIVIADAASGLIVDANPGAEQLTGRARAQLVGLHFTAIHPAAERKHARQLFKRVANGHSTSQLAIERPDHSVVPVEVAAGHCIAVDDRTLIFGSFRDISDRCELEARLRRAERMDAIGQLAAGVAHDFNNQLQNILGFADLLIAKLADEQLLDYAETIATAAERAGELTQQLLAFSQQGVHQSAEVDLHALLGEVVALLERSIGHELVLRCELQAEDPVIHADRESLQTALLNVCLNAREAVGANGEILITTRNVQFATPPLEVTPGLRPGRYLAVAVRDNGQGMNEQVIPRVFEPFFSTKQTGKAAGMGLAMVFGTVKSHGGGIRVESTRGNGSTFTLFLPHKPIARPEHGNTAPARENPQQARIMVVDDEPGIRELLGVMLRKMGHEAVEFGDGESALAHFRKNWREVDMVVLDMVMPGMSGAEVFHELRRINPDSRILIASGHHVSCRADKFHGAAGMIGKPFRISALRDVIVEILGAG